MTHSIAARALWEKTGGKDFEPKDPTNPAVAKLIENGFLIRIDGHIGFEKIKDGMLRWTPAATFALGASKS